MSLHSIKFPIDNFEKLINDISGWEIDEWIKFWEKEQEVLSYVSEY